MKNRVIAILCAVACGFTSVAQTHYTLPQLRELALRNNIAVKNARLGIEAAEQQRKEAFTKYFPNVSGTGLWFNANHDMAKMNIDPSQMISPEASASLSQMLPPELLMALQEPMQVSMLKNGVVASVAAVQPVFSGGRIVNGNKLAKVGEDVSLLQLEMSENEVKKSIELYFWQLVSLQEKTKTIAAVEELLNDIHKDVDVAIKAGVALRNDLLQVELRQNDIESQKLKLQNGISILKLIIAQYCGLEDDNFEVSSPEISTAARQSTGVAWQAAPVDFALTALPEYRLLQKQVEAATLQKKITLGENLPQVGVGVGYTFHNITDVNCNFAMVFASISIPISDWWGGSHAIKRRKIEQQRAIDEMNNNAELLKIRAQRASNDVAETQMQLSIAQRSIEQAAENLRINRDCYRAGTVTMSNLLEAQMLYQQALDKRIEAYADMQNKLLAYRQSIGLPD